MASLIQIATRVDIGGSSSTTHNITVNNTVAGNTLVAVGSFYNEAPGWTVSVSDNAGGSYSIRQSESTNGGGLTTKGVIARAKVISGGSTIVTFTFSAATSIFGSYGCMEWKGVENEQTWDANNDIDTSGATDASAGPITTDQASQVLIGVAAANSIDAALNYASPTNWTNAYRQNDSSSFNGFDAAYWLPGAVQSSYTAQWSHDNNAGDEHSALIVALLSSFRSTRRGYRSQGRRKQRDGIYSWLNVKTWW